MWPVIVMATLGFAQLFHFYAKLLFFYFYIYAKLDCTVPGNRQGLVILDPYQWRQSQGFPAGGVPTVKRLFGYIVFLLLLGYLNNVHKNC